jgi:ABC-type nickel/cobalt efflux system permease component RcnA
MMGCEIVAIRCFLRGVLQSSPARTHKSSIDNTSITELVYTARSGAKGGWFLMRFNDVSHLEGTTLAGGKNGTEGTEASHSHNHGHSHGHAGHSHDHHGHAGHHHVHATSDKDKETIAALTQKVAALEAALAAAKA